MNCDARTVNTIWVTALLIVATLLPVSAREDEVADSIVASERSYDKRNNHLSEQHLKIEVKHSNQQAVAHYKKCVDAPDLPASLRTIAATRLEKLSPDLHSSNNSQPKRNSTPSSNRQKRHRLSESAHTLPHTLPHTAPHTLPHTLPHTAPHTLPHTIPHTQTSDTL